MMETTGLTSDFLGVTKPSLIPSDYAGYSQFFQDDEIVLNKLDFIFFNVFDRIFYQTPFPTKIFMIVFAFMHVQALFGNTFFSNNQFYNVIVMIFLFTNPIKMSPSQFYAFGYTFFAITILIWGFFITISLIIEKQKYISSIPLGIASFLIFIINPLILNPTTYLIKRLVILILMVSSYLKSPDNAVHTNFLKYYRNEDFVHYKDMISDSDRGLLILLLVLLVIAFILQTVMTIFSFRLLSVTPYVPYHLFTGLSMRNVFYQVFLRLIIRLLESFFGFFPRWSTLILYVSNIILYLLSFYFIFLFPVIHSVANSLMIGYSLAGVVGSVLKLSYANDLDGLYDPHYVSILASYILFSFISYLIFAFSIRKKYMPLLAFNNEINIVDLPNDKRGAACNVSTTEKDEKIKQRVFEDERLQIIPYSKKIAVSFARVISRMKLLFLIKVGVENACDMFIDYTLFKFIISTFPEDRDMLRLISIIEMSFPYMRLSFQQLLPIIRVDSMKFNQRFLIYEINTLNKLTETDLSISSTKELSVARTNSLKYQDVVMNTWLLDEITISALDNVITSVKRGDKMWDYILAKYPNLIEAHKLYHQFSIECKTDFYQAASTTKQIKKIEDHKLNIKDRAFISFVRTFPVYLTHHILTPNGFLEDFNSSDAYKEEPENSENMSSLTEPTDYEAKLRFAIFRATHKSKANSSKFMEFVIYIFFVIFIVAELALALVYYQTFTDEMENTDILRYYRHLTSNLSLTNSYVLLKYATLFSKNSTVNTHSIIPFRKGHPSPVPTFEFDFFYYYNKYNITDSFFDTSEDTLDFNILTRSLQTATSFQLLYFEMKDLSENGFYDVDEITELMFYSPIEVGACYESKKILTISQDLPRTFIYHTINQITLSFDSEIDKWLTNSNSFCNIFSSFAPITGTLRDVRFQTYQVFMDTNRTKKNEILLTTLLLSLIISIVYLVIFIISNARFLKELHYFADILSSLDEEEKRNGANPILVDSTLSHSNVTVKNTNNDDNATNNNNNNINVDKNMIPIQSSSKRAFYYSMMFVCAFMIVLQGVFLFLIGYVAYQMKTYDLTVTYWNFFNKLRIPQYLEIFDTLAMTCILRTHQTNATTYQIEKQRCYDLIETTESSSTFLVTSNEDGESILGKSEIFDEYYLRTTCLDEVIENEIEDNDGGGDFHSISKESKAGYSDKNESNFSFLKETKVDDNNNDVFRSTSKKTKVDDPYEWIDDRIDMYTDEEFECMSMSSKILIYIQIARDALQKIERDTMTDSLNDYIISRIAYLYYILNKYICADINLGDSIITKMGDDYLSQSKRNIILLLIASIIISVASFFINLYYKSFLNSIYQGGIILVRRLNPNEMAANHRLVSFLLNKGINKKNYNKELNVTQSIVHYSSDMLFYLSNNGIILITNQAILQNLAYSPEQIVGKPIYFLFEEDSKKEIQKNIALLEKNDNQGMIQLNITCYTASSAQIYVSLMMFQTSSKHIVIIMKNLKDILEKQRILSEMKNNCLSLYYSILPSFVAKLKNIEEKDISFLVPTATIIFVDFAHFTEFSRTLSPEQLLSVLSSIYSQYDAKLREYKSLTKIKIIGDIFMCAGGLFNSQGDKKNDIPTSNSNIGPVIGGIKNAKPKDSPDSKALSKRPSFGTGSNADIQISPLSSRERMSTQINYSSTLHDIHLTLGNPNQPNNNMNNNMNNSNSVGDNMNNNMMMNNNYIQNQDLLIRPSFSDVESALQSEQIIFQSSIARMESDFMTPDASVASQAVRFGFDTIEVVEDINMKNNFSLAVRVGISTGGPIVAGVLGDDRLDFEIFGKEISFTMRLQKTGIPGKVVISDSTYNLISNLQYSFEDRDIFIKGKGNYRTHIIQPFLEMSTMP